MDSSVADSLVLWLATYWIHSSIILGGVWSFTRLRSQSSLSLRETLWRVGLLAPVATATLQIAGLASPLMGSITISEAIVAPVATARDFDDSGQAVEEPGPIPGETSIDSASAPTLVQEGSLDVFGTTRIGWSSLVVSLWLFGAVLMLLRTLLSALSLRRILADREVVVSGPIVNRAQRVAAIAGLPQVPRITVSAHIPGP